MWGFGISSQKNLQNWEISSTKLAKYKLGRAGWSCQGAHLPAAVCSTDQLTVLYSSTDQLTVLYCSTDQLTVLYCSCTAAKVPARISNFIIQPVIGARITAIEQSGAV